MAIDIEKLAEALQAAEIVILKALKKTDKADIEALKSASGLSGDILARAALWLQNKGLVNVKEKEEKFASLSSLGEKYTEETLPEKRFLSVLKDPMFLEEIEKAGRLGSTELKFALGYLKAKALIKFESGKASITDAGTAFLKKKSLEELFLEKLSKEKELNTEKLSSEEKYAFEALKKRGLVIQSARKLRDFEITSLGEKLEAQILKEKKRIGTLTPDLIKTKGWEKISLRRYDISAPVPKLFAGKKQAYRAFLDEVKGELVSMGFEEMTGSLVQTSFFNCDALYMPQDHPARGIHDIYFVKEPKYADLSKYSKFVKAVKQVHEKGGFGSTGWQTKFDEKETARYILRSQGTALTARTLMNPNLKIPGKYFAVARCYRPDKIDVTHLTEFNQCEGIILGEKLNFRQLLGLLRDFAVKITKTNKVKIVPVAYFPFTEPSAAGYVYNEKLGTWMEILGAGVFRPELTGPLGIKSPVLAWTFGIDRLFMIKENIADIRQLFSYDLDWLREAKL